MRRALRIVLATLNAKYVQTSLALRYLETIARRAGHEVARCEFSINDRLDLVEAEIARHAPDLLALSCYLWNIEPLLELADTLKKVLPGLRILLGGPEVSHDAPAFLAQNPAVDWIIAGEGEGPWAELLAALPAGPLDSVRGLCWRDGARIRANDPAPPQPFAALPSAYAERTPDLAGRLVYYESSRGCPYSCAFCLSGREGRVRLAELDRVRREIEILAGSGARAIKFVDRTFNCRPRHALAVWRALLPYHGRLRFHFEIVAEILTAEELDFLAGVPPGLFQFEIGVQSTNPETLEAVGRRRDLGRLAANVRALRAAGNIHLHLDLIAGLPHEGFDRFLESLDFVLDLDPDVVQVGILKMLRGTRLREQAELLGYRYRRRPPYEVLANPWLSFTELDRLRIVADLVETYYNEGRFGHTLKRLFAAVPSPARLFHDFAGYCVDRGWHLRPHQPQTLAEHLLEFVERRGLGGPVLRDRLRLDLHRLARSEGEPDWVDVPMIPDFQRRWHAWLRVPEHRALLGPEFEELGPREAIKRTRVMAFRHDPLAPPDEEEPGPALVAVVYPEKGVKGRARAIRVEI
ncbi:MAG: B12-binding domain-containing radical SAM protein [Bacteroidota bacterium]